MAQVDTQLHDHLFSKCFDGPSVLNMVLATQLSLYGVRILSATIEESVVLEMDAKAAEVLSSIYIWDCFFSSSGGVRQILNAMDVYLDGISAAPSTIFCKTTNGPVEIKSSRYLVVEDPHRQVKTCDTPSGGVLKWASFHVMLNGLR